jgi:hypothetical protein
MTYGKRPGSVQDIFNLISAVPSGQAVLERFVPLFESGKVRVESYPLPLVEQLRAAVGEDQPIGACFINDGETGTIHIDTGSAIGILAPFLIHEMIHALDPTVWKASRSPQTQKRKDEIFLRAEVSAFEGQASYMKEMKERFPEYRAFLATQYPRARILHERLTCTDLIELYGFRVA